MMMWTEIQMVIKHVTSQQTCEWIACVAWLCDDDNVTELVWQSAVTDGSNLSAPVPDTTCVRPSITCIDTAATTAIHYISTSGAGVRQPARRQHEAYLKRSLLDQCFEFNSVLWHCWLGVRKDIQFRGSLLEQLKEEDWGRKRWTRFNGKWQ